MKNLIHSLLPQWAINNFYHLPKAILANILYGFPFRKLKVIGVTGTDGKTTTVNMIYQILKQTGKKVSMISTINGVIAGKSYDTGFHVTSPDPLTVQKLAQEALNNGDEYLVLEVTSHALDQYRFWGIKFEVGVITNVTHEHLDYHGNFENYLKTKFRLTGDAKFAVLNQGIGGVRASKVVTFGLENGDFNQKEIKLKLQIPGEYNIENALAALAVAYVLGIDKEQALRSLRNFKGLIGRMEEVKNNRGIRIIIDFAHTPNGLEQALKALRTSRGPKDQQASPGRLIAVFGAASQRDILKRPMMGKISAKLADITILTDEDPRFESRNKIIEEIAAGAYSKGAKDMENLYKEPDRKKAIRLAISLSRAGDIIGIFGKGHERSMNYQGIERPWSDREAVEEALSDG